jgi:integrin alpha FG-GAP repeat containing protein 1
LTSPGSLIKIETTSFEYQKVVLYASQSSQSAYMALQLPYVIFGLGSTANFVEHLTVGLAATMANSEIGGFHKEWTQIIPNSHLVIVPNKRHYPFNWRMQLFITPSKNILMTAISLGSTMVGLIIVIGLLQYREKVSHLFLLKNVQKKSILYK